MSSFVVPEALTVGFKEGLKLGIILIVLGAYLARHDMTAHLRSIAVGVFSAFLLAVLTPFLAPPMAVKEITGNIVATSFAVFLLASGWALMDASGLPLFSPAKGFGLRRAVPGGLVFFSAVFYVFPDFLGSFLFLREAALLKENAPGTYVSAFAGFGAAGILFLRLLFRRGVQGILGSLFDLPQILLFLSMVKLVAGGTKGLAEMSLIPSVQRGLMKFSHDVIHQLFVLLMVPDHPLLKTTVWNFIGVFFGPNIASLEALLIILALPLLFLSHSLFDPIQAAPSLKGPERRRVRHAVASERTRKAIPVAVFITLIVSLWFVQRGESVSRLYNPTPKPVVEDRGMVLIPITDPTMNLTDGSLYKFSLSHDGQSIRIMVIKRPEKGLTACLDACEICPPDGYGQRDDHVICIYCNTPIPVRTLGQPGGCNPIPLVSSVDETFLRIEVGEILRKWEYVKSGKSREAVR